MAFARERLAGLHALFRERHFDHDVLVDAGETPAFADHAGRVGRDDLRAHRTLHRLADLLQDLTVVTRLLREQRWMGRHAVEDADGRKRFDFLEIACVYEKLHTNAPKSVCHRLLAFARSTEGSQPPEGGSWELELGSLRGGSNVFVEPVDRALPRLVGRGLVVALRRGVVVEAVDRAGIDVTFVRD